jgi:hypothetical protein
MVCERIGAGQQQEERSMSKLQKRAIDLSRTTYDQAVAEAKRLYGVAEGAWIELCLYLRAIENAGLWQRGPDALATFADFMRATFPTAFGEEAYRNRINLIEGYGSDVARKVDPMGSRTLTSAPLLNDLALKAKAVAAIEDNYRTHGTPMHVEDVRKVVHALTRDVVPQRQPVRLASIEEAHALRAENARLKMELRVVTKQRDALARRVEELERKAQSRTGKSKRTHAQHASA